MWTLIIVFSILIAVSIVFFLVDRNDKKQLARLKEIERNNLADEKAKARVAIMLEELRQERLAKEQE